MKIDFLITELNVGGAEKALVELACGLHQRGHRIRVVAIGSPPPPDRDRLIRQLAQAGIATQFGGFDSSTKAFAAWRWLIRQLRDSQPDVCQTFLFHANCLGTRAARSAGVPVVVGGLRVAEPKRFRLMCERVAARSMDRVVCVSSKVRDFAIESLAIPADRCRVIPNGVDVPRYRDAVPFRWSTLNWPDDSSVALFVGRLHPQKGIELITKHWSQIAAGRSNRKLLLVGEGPLQDSLERWATDIGPDKVRMLPWQSEVAPLMKSARMLLLPSHYEGMPNVVLEAMAAGRPVVCSRVHGSDELLAGDPGSAGAVDRMGEQSFPPGDGDAFVRCATALFDTPDRSTLLGQLNQQHVGQRFSYSEMISHYEALYEALTASPVKR